MVLVAHVQMWSVSGREVFHRPKASITALTNLGSLAPTASPLPTALCPARCWMVPVMSCATMRWTPYVPSRWHWARTSPSSCLQYARYDELQLIFMSNCARWLVPVKLCLVLLLPVDVEKKARLAVTDSARPPGAQYVHLEMTALSVLMLFATTSGQQSRAACIVLLVPAACTSLSLLRVLLCWVCADCCAPPAVSRAL